MTLREIADLVDGTLAVVAPDAGGSAPPMSADAISATSVEFDSRRVRPGALFLALPGEHADGHDFAAAAAKAGAVAVLGTRPVPELPTIVVAEPGEPGSGVLAALATLATHVAHRLVAAGLTIVGVTGSAGKTSTKDLLASVLSHAGTVVAPRGSFNNELGHPYTVLMADEHTDFLVLELSARGIGHIASLATIAPPRIGAVLNVGSAHLGEFGSREAIAVAKGELVEALPPAANGGVAVLNGDDPLVDAMAARTEAAVVRTGTTPAADIRAEDVSLDDEARAHFTLVTPEGSAPVQLVVVGAHQVANALAVAAVARAVGMTVAAVARALSSAGPQSHWRMAVTKVPGGVTVINDAYNANPESMTAALAALERIGGDHRRWAVLGEMAELGAESVAAHRRVGEEAARTGARVVAVGEAARPLFDAAKAVAAQVGGPEPVWVADRDAAAALLMQEIEAPDAVLVKASRSVGLERVALRLIDELPSKPARRSPAVGRTDQEPA